MQKGAKHLDGNPHDAFRGIADPTRRNIMEMLSLSDMSIAEIARRLPISRTAVIKHLNMLLESGLATRTRSGRKSVYSLNIQPLSDIAGWLSYFSRYWDERLGNLRKYLEGE